MSRNLKFYLFVAGFAYRPRTFEVVAPNFTEAYRLARLTVGGRHVNFAGLSGSLPGVHTHPLYQEEVARVS